MPYSLSIFRFSKRAHSTLARACLIRNVDQAEESMSLPKYIFPFFWFVGVLSCYATQQATTPLDIPFSIERSGSVPAAIADAISSLKEEDKMYFGEAVNALREELAIGASETLSDANARKREVALLDGMTPRQIILAGLVVYRRQTHDPRAGKDRFQHWAAKFRYSDEAIEKALVRFAKKG